MKSGHCREAYQRYHLAMDATPPMSVGLGGDGDEIVAIGDVEHAFGVKLDYADAPHWHTAGDVFSSLRKALPSGLRDEKDVWPRFTQALSAGTGVDPERIERSSPLLSQSRLWVRVANASALFWVVLAGVLLALALLRAFLNR